MVASPFYSLRFQILTAAFAVITLVFPTKAASNDTSLRIGPVVWPSDPLRDPYHVHSGHVIRRAGSKSYDELDLLSFLSPSMHNSDIHLNGTLYPITAEAPKHAVNRSSPIILMSCDGEHAKEDFVRATMEEVQAIILYTDVGNCCVFESNNWQTLGPHQPILFTFTNMKATDPLDISAYKSASSGVDVVVEYWAQLDEHMDPYSDQPTPDHHASTKNPTNLMVYILVSAIATGFVIIMLFLGLRAYKRMEGGPIQQLGSRPRQSRARGIARAALDAIPIIKFRTRPQEALDKDLEMQDKASSLGQEDLTTEVRSDGGGLGGTPVLEPLQRDGTSANPETTNAPTSYPLPHSTSSSSKEAPIPDSSIPSQTRCPVCLDDFEEDQAVRVLPCSHSFHIDCIDPWLLNVAGSCPLCRIDLSSPEECAQDLSTNSLTPQPTTLISRSRNSSGLSRRLQEMIEVARNSSALEERLAALRAVRDEDGNGNRWGHVRSKKLELGISRLGRAMLGSGSGENSGNLESRTSTLQVETERPR